MPRGRSLLIYRRSWVPGPDSFMGGSRATWVSRCIRKRSDCPAAASYGWRPSSRRPRLRPDRSDRGTEHRQRFRAPRPSGPGRRAAGAPPDRRGQSDDLRRTLDPGRDRCARRRVRAKVRGASDPKGTRFRDNSDAQSKERAAAPIPSERPRSRVSCVPTPPCHPRRRARGCDAREQRQWFREHTALSASNREDAVRIEMGREVVGEPVERSIPPQPRRTVRRIRDPGEAPGERHAGIRRPKRARADRCRSRGRRTRRAPSGRPPRRKGARDASGPPVSPRWIS